MAILWNYFQNGTSKGPISEEEIILLISQRQLIPSDLVWPLGRNRKDAAPAGIVFNFPLPPPPKVSVPEWVADVEKLETKGPLFPISHNHENPDWLDDLRLWFGLEVFIPKKPANNDVEHPAKQEQIPVPDWLKDWPPSNSETSISIPKPSKPIPTESFDLNFDNPMVEKKREETGFDVITGKILDSIQFGKWKQKQTNAQSANQPAVNQANIMELFRKGRLEIETWVDEKMNRISILHSVIDEIKKHPEILTILKKYENFGLELQEKLLHHLVFMIENRRKYYWALTGRKENK